MIRRICPETGLSRWLRAHLRSLILIALSLCFLAEAACAIGQPVVDASSAAGKTGGAKIASAYYSPECRFGCIIDATELQHGSDLDLDGFNAQNLIAISKPVQIRLGQGDYHLSGSVMLRGVPAACEGKMSGATCVVDGMSLVGAGSGRTRLHFTKDPKRLVDRRLVMMLSHFSPNRVPDMFAPEPADNAIAGPVILPGSSSFEAQDAAQTLELQPGTWVLVGNMHRHPSNGAADFQQYEWKQVAQASGGSVRVTESFVNAYNTRATSCGSETQGCDKAYWIALASLPSSPQVSGLTIVDETMSLNPTALYVSGAIDPLVRDVHTRIGVAAGAGAFALRLYRTLRPKVDGFFAEGAGTRIEVSHAIEGHFTGIRTRCPAAMLPTMHFFVSVDFGSTANVFDGNETDCGAGFLVIEADNNVFTRNTITMPRNALRHKQRGARSSSTAFVVYGGVANRFQGNVIKGFANGLSVADFPAGNGQVWAPKVMVHDGSCVRPSRQRWLFFCTRDTGMTGALEPDFASALAAPEGEPQVVIDADAISWSLAGSVHPSTGSLFEANRLIDESGSIVSQSRLRQNPFPKVRKGFDIRAPLRRAQW